MLPRDYYARLGVPRGADARRLREAYRRQARRYHPDQNPDDPEAEANFRLVAEAYEVLSNPEKRRQYDLLGPDWEWRAEVEMSTTATASAGRRHPAGSSTDPRHAWTTPGDLRAAGADLLRSAARFGALLVCLIAVAAGLQGWSRPLEGSTQAPSVSTAEPEDPLADRMWRMTGPVEDLRMTMSAMERSILGSAVGTWKNICVESRFNRNERSRATMRHNYYFSARPYRQRLDDAFDRAEAAGFFDLPLAAADRAQIDATLSARAQASAWLGLENGFDCTDPRQPAEFVRLAEIFGKGAECVGRLRKAGPRKVSELARSGRAACGPETQAVMK